VFKRLLTVRNLIILGLVILLFVGSSLLGLKVTAPLVSIAAEPIFHLGPLTITNALFTAWLVMLVLVLASLAATRRIPKDLEAAPESALVPHGFQNFVEMVIEGFYNLVRGISGTWANRFFPIVMTIFLFVIVSNWMGLLPGFGSIGILEHPHSEDQVGYIANGALLTPQEAGNSEEGYILVPLLRSPSTDLNFTLALALVAVILTQYFGLSTQKTGYVKRFFDTSGFRSGALIGVAQFFAGLLELLGEFTKLVSFSFRLFGNIFAGEVLLGVMAFLIPYIVSLPFLGLEVFVGFVQAVVFMMLALVFFVNATASHSQEHAAGREHH
jgi:F-type H+-transporting ATPase subunit a